MTKKQKAIAVVNEMIRLYPDAECSLVAKAPHELLIATRLSAQCTDKRVNIVTKPLFEKYRSVDDFAKASVDDVGEIIRSCGLYKTKARDIVNMCIMLRDVYGSKVPDTIDELTKLPGVGRKTANLIVGDVYGKPAVVTDTHLIRITNRLGLVDTKEPKKVEFELKKLLPPEESNNFCHRMVMFGRDVCKAPTPKCEICTLHELCKEYKSKNKKK
ncbi:MAG: endonuclease III [Acutalibacteraceae bacterium]